MEFIVHFFISRKGRLGAVVIDHEAHRYSRDEVLECLPPSLQGRALELRPAETMAARNVTMQRLGLGLAPVLWKAARVVIHRVD